MKLKSLLVVTLLVLGCCAAFGQSYSFGFLSYTGGLEYCNYETFTAFGPVTPSFYLQGYDVLSACAYSLGPAASINGIKATFPKSAEGPVTGGGYFYADQLYDAYYGYVTGLQWSVFTATKAPKKITSTTKFGWAGYVGEVGYEFLGNYGFLSATIPSAAHRGAKSTISNMSVAKLKAKGEALKAQRASK